MEQKPVNAFSFKAKFKGVSVWLMLVIRDFISW